MAEVKTVNNILREIREKSLVIHTESTIAECYQRLQADPLLQTLVKAFHQGQIQEDWGTLVAVDDVVIFAVVPAGGGDSSGKMIMSAIAMIAIMVVAPYAAPTVMSVAMPMEAAFISGAAYLAIESAIAAGIGIVGALAVGALFKPTIPSINAPVTAQLEQNSSVANPLISAQSNSARRGGIIPVIFGHHTVFPDLAVIPYVEKAGCRQTLHAIYCLGHGDVSASLESIRVGGIPLQELNEQNQEQWGPIKTVIQTVTGQGVLHGAPNWGYKGRRHVESMGVLIKEPVVGTTYPVYANVVAPADRVYLDVVFPQGIWNIDTATGERTEHTVFLTVQKEVNGVFVDISMDDISDGYEGGLLCADEGIDGTITDTTTEKYSWAKVKEILENGSGTVSQDIDLVYIKDICCDSESANISKGSGWNGGLPGGKALPCACGSDNGKNVTPYARFTAQYRNYHRLTNPASNGNLYYVFTPQSFNNLAGVSGNFIEGIYTATIRVDSPISYRTTPTGDDTLVSDMELHFFANAYKADGTKVPVGSVTKATANKTFLTTLSVQFDVGKTNPYVLIQFGLTIDYKATRTSASRQGGIRVVSLAAICRPTISIPGVATHARILVKVPIPTPGGIDPAFLQPAPIIGDVMYFGNATSQDCETCQPLDISYPAGVFDMASSYYYPLAGTRHVITEVKKTDLNTNNLDQHWQEYEVGLDDPIQISGDVMYNMRVYQPGFSVRANYRAPIHMGIMLDAAGVTRFKITKETVSAGTEVEEATLASVSSIADSLPLVIVPGDNNLRYTFLEIAVPANESIGTTLKPLSIDVNRGVRDFSADHYDIDAVHSNQPNPVNSMDMNPNPAWAYLNVLMGSPAGRPIKIGHQEKLSDVIDLESFRAWAVMCSDQNFKFTHIVTGYSTIGDLLGMIAASGRARPTFRDGRHSIIFDGDPRYFTGDVYSGNAKPIIRQLITPENSWNGSSKMTYVGDTHALKVSYTDVDASQQMTVVVYAPNFEKTGNDFDAGEAPPWMAQKYETLSLPGVGYGSQAGLLGYYFMEEVRLRRERVIRTMDVEALISLEGDIVGVASDVMKLGGKPARVVSATGSTGTVTVTLDMQIANMPNSVVRLRYWNDTEKAPKVTDQLSATVDPNNAGDNSVVQFAVPAGAKVEIGYMLIWGTQDRVTQDYQIVAMRYSADMTVTLELLEYYADPLNYDGNRVTIPETNPEQGTIKPVTDVVLGIEWASVGDGWMLQYKVDWQPVKAAASYRLKFAHALRGIITSETTYTTRPAFSGCDHPGGTMGVTVIAVDAFGNESEPEEAFVNNNLPIVIPPNVDRFGIALTQSGAELEWVELPKDAYEYQPTYQIRFSPGVDAAAQVWDHADIIWEGGGSIYYAANYRRGTFLIKAVGPCNTLSVTAAIIVSDVIAGIEIKHKETVTLLRESDRGTIESCVGNVCTWKKGPLDKVGTVTIACPDNNEVWAIFDPNYQAAAIPRNSEVYMMPTQLAYQGPARGTNDNACGWPDDGKIHGPLYFRTWAGAGALPTGHFRQVLPGEYHIFDNIQFAIRHEEGRPAVGYRQDIAIDIAYAARTESGEDVVCPVGGVTVTYANPFRTGPAVSIMGQDMRPGDRWVIENKKFNAPIQFTIKFYDSSGGEKEVTFDWIANGYGVGR